MKTELARCVAETKFSHNYMPTIGVDITTKRVTVEGKHVRLILVDTAHQGYFNRIRRSYYQSAFAYIIFFEKHNDTSFAAVPSWLEEIRGCIPDDSVLVLVGIISDQPEQVRHVTARKYALYWGVDFYAIKSTDEYSFEDLLKDITKRYFEKLRKKSFY